VESLAQTLVSLDAKELAHLGEFAGILQQIIRKL
jgi:hypothetical protein